MVRGRPEYAADIRHIRWLHEVLTAGRFNRVLEIGCFEGRSTTAFLDACRAGWVAEVHLCELRPLVCLKKVLAQFDLGNRVTLHREPSCALLARDDRWGLVYVDGDHSVATVRDETTRLLRSGVPAVFAHDTSAHGRYAHCAGPQFLKAAFQAAGYRTLEDSLFRPGEQTDRGMFFATSKAELYEIALVAFRRHCSVRE
jgi:predicted O-methyltransferase YrrM